MKALDVSDLQNGIDDVQSKIDIHKEQLTQIETAVTGIVSLSDSLKGEGGAAIRRFYQQGHLPFLQFLKLSLTQYSETLSQMKAALQTLEPAANGRIQESFLEQDVEQGLRQVELVTANITNETNATMQKVSDIVALPPLRDDEVRQSILQARQEKNQTLEQLHQFDYEQAAALDSVEADILLMRGYVSDIQNLFKGGEGLNISSNNLMLTHSSHILLMNKLSQHPMAPNRGPTNQLNSLLTNWQEPITFNKWSNPSCVKPVATSATSAKAEVKEETGATGFFKGAWEGVAKAFTDTVDGIKRLVTEPVEVMKETVDFITDVADDQSMLLDIGHALWTSFDENVINGTAATRGEWIGYTSAIIGGSVLGDKGLSKVTHASRLGRLGGQPGYQSQHQLQLHLAAQNSVNQATTAATNVRGLSSIREKAQQSMNKVGAAVQQMKPNAGLQPAMAGIPHNVINTSGMRNQLGEMNQANLIRVEQAAGVNQVSRGNHSKSNKEVNKNNEAKDGTFAEAMSLEDATRYEQFWDYAKNGIKVEDRVKLNNWKFKPSGELYKNHKGVYDNSMYYNQLNGNINWPENNGFFKDPQTNTLEKSLKIDRYGEPSGSFFSEKGTPFEQRALAPHSSQSNYYSYEVKKPFKTLGGEAAPWFDQPGGGMQYIGIDKNGDILTVQDLIDGGYIK
ncbi:T7SS effector LXG polymorphic toxin [Alkalihalophilus sp. As8PL]|uniref:T7SS effector LXG polymorphic toxin n=1 Tax=Alkalihalophilus sp. As8PL TaxID=3237103 RepID=A0AB39BPG4_9BACI